MVIYLIFSILTACIASAYLTNNSVRMLYSQQPQCSLLSEPWVCHVTLFVLYAITAPLIAIVIFSDRLSTTFCSTLAQALMD